MTESGKAVFLSYASEDAVAAERICSALLAAGIAVWFDKSELRGGDEWDAAIRQQIKACSLFLPIISLNTQARGEGYFRLEWKLAVDRSHLMAADQAFLLPIVIDNTRDPDARVPDRFREVQWTRLPGGETPSSFVTRVARLLDLASANAIAPTSGVLAVHRMTPATAKPRRAKFAFIAVLMATLLTTLGLLGYRGTFAPRDGGGASAPTSAEQSANSAFNPPPHSIAVLPFVNMSGDPKQDYFSDGLSEELLNSLVTVRDLQVAARTSSFSFKGTNAKLADISRQLNVGAVLEGSVRKDGNQVRITAQLINTVSGFTLWSQTYDRDLKNVLALQGEIAVAVTNALQAKLMAGTANAIELGGTTNPRAFDAYLRGEGLRVGGSGKDNLHALIAAYEEALKLDPGYAKAYAGKANAVQIYGGLVAQPSDYAKYNDEALRLARKAIQLAPELGRAHSTLAQILLYRFDFTGAQSEIERALQLASGDGVVLRTAVRILIQLGQADRALATAQRSVVLDPLNGFSHASLAFSLGYKQRFPEAIQAIERARLIDPKLQMNDTINVAEGQMYQLMGELDKAVAACRRAPLGYYNHICLAIVLQQQGHRVEAQAEVDKVHQEAGDSAAFQYAEVHAMWGDVPKALQWLDTAYRLHDSGMAYLKSSFYLAPLRDQARYKELVQLMHFPD